MSERADGDGFVAGLVSRHDAAAAALASAYAPVGFAPVAVGRPPERAHTQAAAAPRHFSPADPAARPTAGWNPLDPSLQQTHVDPLAVAHAAGYAEGLAAAAAAQHERTRDETLVEDLSAQLAGLGRFDREAVARRLRDTVLALTARLVGEVGVSSDLLGERIGAATELMADAAESAMLRLHPDDVALLDGRLSANVFAIGDASLARGSFVLESASTIVEDGPAMWLDQLAAALDRVAVPVSGPEPSC